MAVLVTAFVAETESLESGINRSIQGLKRFEDAATSVSSNLSTLQNQINSQFKSAGGATFTKQIKQQMEARSQLENMLFEATHNSKDVALRNLSNTFNEMRSKFAGHEEMLTLINQTENAKRTQIIQEYESSFKNSLLRMRAQYVQYARSLIIVGVSLKLIKGLADSINVGMQKGTLEGTKVLIRSIPVIGGLMIETSESIAELGANMHSSATEAQKYEETIKRASAYEESINELLKRRTEIQGEINQLNFTPSLRGKWSLSQDYEKEIARINQIQKTFLDNAGGLPEGVINRMMTGFDQMREKASQLRDLKLAEPYKELEDELYNQVTLLGKSKIQADLYNASLKGVGDPQTIESIKKLSEALESGMKLTNLQEEVANTRKEFEKDISTAGMDSYEKKIWEVQQQLEALLKLPYVSPAQEEQLKDTIINFQKMKNMLPQLQSLEKPSRGAENIQEMLNALDFEYSMMGKINEERERAIELARFQKMVEQEYGGDLQKQEELMGEYREKLERNAAGKEGFTAFTQKIANYGQEATNVWSNLGDIGVNALDGMSGALTELCVKGRTDFKSLAASILQDILQMMIRMMMMRAIMAAFGMGAGPTGQAIGGGVPLPDNLSMGAIYGKGGLFLNGSVIPFASGAIFNRSTLFPMANGAVGMMGEAGPEAIMPLTRDSSGRLGVAAGQSQPNVNLKVVNVVDKRQTLDAMTGTEGEKVIMNAIKRNKGIVAGMLR